MLDLKRAVRNRGEDQGAPDQRLGLGGALAGAPSSNRSLKQDTKRRWSWRRQQADEAATGGSEWSGSSDLASKAITVAMVLAMVAGPVALVRSLGEEAPQVVQKSSGAGVAGDMVEASVRAGEEGLLSVRAWLASTQERPRIDVEGQPQWPAKPTELIAPRVAQVEQAGKGVDRWQVTIAGTLPEGQEAYFAVPIEVRGQKASAVALPSMVPAPGGMEASPPSYTQQGIPLSSPLAGAVGDFLTAYMAGTDTTRFVSPGSHVPPVTGSPWTGVRIDQVDAEVASGADATSARPAEGEKAHVLVRYVMQDQGGEERADGIPASMSLSLTARGGRWEVTSIDPMPQLAPASPTKTSPPHGEATENQ